MAHRNRLTWVFVLASPLAACTGNVATDADSGDDGSSSGGMGGQDSPKNPTDVPSQPLSPVDLEKACTVDSAFPRRVLRLAAPELMASVAKAVPNISPDWPADLKEAGQTQRADDSLVVSRPFYDTVNEAAKGIAKQMTAAVPSALACAPAKFGVEAACTTSFLDRWLPSIFRGRNDANDAKALAALAQSVAARSGGEQAFEIVVRATLLSPKFLYVPEGIDALLAGKAQGSNPMSGPELAAFLSYRVLGEPPTPALLKATNEKLLNVEAIAAVVKQQFTDQQRQAAVATFLRGWLSTADIPKLKRDAAKHPQADPTFMVKLRDETEVALTRAASDASVGLTALLTAPQKSALLDANGAQDRPGFFALPGVLAAASAADHTNIPRRGRVLMRQLFCEEAPLPPPGVTLKVPPLPETASERQRFEAVETLPSCAGCHVTIDHLAYPFETFNELGQARVKDEKGNSIDTTSTYQGPDGVKLQYNNAGELMKKASASSLVKGCFALHTFRHAASRFERGDADACMVRDVAKTVAAPNASLADILMAALSRTAFANRGDK